LAKYIYPANEEETPPQIVLAFKEGTYHNVPDFWLLWEKLRNSLTRVMLSVERDFVARASKEDIEPMQELSGINFLNISVLIYRCIMGSKGFDCYDGL